MVCGTKKPVLSTPSSFCMVAIYCGLRLKLLCYFVLAKQKRDGDNNLKDFRVIAILKDFKGKKIGGCAEIFLRGMQNFISFVFCEALFYPGDCWSQQQWMIPCRIKVGFPCKTLCLAVTHYS